ncbi:hypothetical protein [Streptomyces sp. NBC_01565]|uniref:terpene synthase family protein n=1 Tax=unclassified Streptomyces TaxID=2593676 RepID=UPI002256A610|nr:hypothetical protein [Streptomyces sp. NBC_01565]MCX4545951.1 hypothetical protein [Streptomyces sp. NBC_01565]
MMTRGPEIERFRFPVIAMPYEPSCSPYVDEVRGSSQRWAAELGIASSDVEVRRLRRADYGFLCSMFFSEAPLPVLSLGTQWLTWTFVLDDVFSDFHQSGSPETAETRRTVARLAGFLSRDRTLRPGTAMEHALVDLLRRTASAVEPELLGRFIGDVIGFVEGYAWEARNRTLRRTPDLVDHIQRRRQVSGALLMLDLVELSLGMTIPKRLYQTHPVRVLVESAADHIMHVNDIFSLKKEIAHLDLHNNVHIVNSTLGLGLQDSVDFVNRLAASQIRLHEHTVGNELPALLDHLAADDEDLRRDIMRWTRQLERSMAGSLKWHQETHRYDDIELWRPHGGTPSA